MRPSLSVLLIALCLAVSSGCDKGQQPEGPFVKGEQDRQAMNPVTTVAEALKRVENYKGAAKDFVLPVADSLQDPAGANMAIITDKILGKSFFPNGFEQKDGFRVYKYKDKL